MPTQAALRQYPCQELVELVTEYLEDALDPRERASFEAHLATCTGCRNYVDQMRTTMRLLDQVPAPPLEPEVRDSLLDIFRSWRQTNANS